MKHYFPEIKIFFLYVALKLKSVILKHPVHYTCQNKLVTIDLGSGYCFSETLEGFREDVIVCETEELEQ